METASLVFSGIAICISIISAIYAHRLYKLKVNPYVAVGLVNIRQDGQISLKNFPLTVYVENHSMQDSGTNLVALQITMFLVINGNFLNRKKYKLWTDIHQKLLLSESWHSYPPSNSTDQYGMPVYKTLTDYLADYGHPFLGDQMSKEKPQKFSLQLQLDYQVAIEKARTQTISISYFFKPVKITSTPQVIYKWYIRTKR